jgi:ATP-dependent Clp protease ATP-binding subunit ClpA
MVLMLGGAGKLVATSGQARNQPWLRKLYPRIDQVPAAFDTAHAMRDAHLLSALLDQDEGIALPLLNKVGVNVAKLKDDVKREISRFPKQSGDIDPQYSREVMQALDAARSIHVSTRSVAAGGTVDITVDVRLIAGRTATVTDLSYQHDASQHQRSP